MVSRSIYPELAAHVLDAISIGEGEAIYITGGAHQQEFLEEIGIQVACRGGQPFIQAVSNDYQKRLMETCSAEQYRRTPKILKGAVEAMDKYIIIEPYSDPAFKAGYREKMQARSEGMFPITKIIYEKPGKPWIYMGWATEGMARMYHVSLEVMEKLAVGGCNIDYHRLKADCEQVMGMLHGARRVRVTDKHGTDFWLGIEGRRLNSDDGLWSAEKAAKGDHGGNLPAGEVFVAPIETEGEGTIYCPVTIDDLTRSVLIKGILLYFKDGVLIPEKCTAKEGQDILRDTLARFV
ncbi:MAG TPA: aminopeptidase, partial [Methanocella sp.]|nr:aminopeptidase [Methanocella sp.]